MNRLLTLSLCLLFLLGLTVGVGTHAQEKKQAKEQPAAEGSAKNDATGVKVEIEPGSLLDQMELARTAATLVRTGRESKDPESLIVAARLLARVDIQDLKKRVEKDSKLDLPPSVLTPSMLLDEAAKLGNGKANIEASVKAARQALSESPRGRIPGPFGTSAVVPPGYFYTVNQNFSGYNRIDYSSTTPGARLSLKVYAPTGQLLGEYIGACVWIEWFGTGTYHIEHRNLSPFPVDSMILTN